MKLTIIGAGPGGYSAAFAAAKAGVEVTLVERAKLGGTCLHTGCIPTKTLRSSADVLEISGRLAEFGITGECALKADMPAIVNRKRKVTRHAARPALKKRAPSSKSASSNGKAELVKREAGARNHGGGHGRGRKRQRDHRHGFLAAGIARPARRSCPRAVK